MVYRGDFNVIRFPQERTVALMLSQALMEFNDFINEAELVDLPLGGNFLGLEIVNFANARGLIDFWCL